MMRPQRRDYAQGYPPQIYNNQMGGPNGPPMGGGGPQQMNGMGGGGVGGGPGGPQQMQQNHGMQLQGGGMGPNSASDGQSNSQGPSNPEMNLANVLHYLQSEWRRWERDRNEWEIERAEMRVRVTGACRFFVTSEQSTRRRDRKSQTVGLTITGAHRPPRGTAQVRREPQGRSVTSRQDA